MKHDYSRSDIISSLKKSGIKKNNIVFCHSDVASFGIPSCKINNKEIANLFLNAFFSVLGDGGTLIIPTFTYSFCKKKIYDPNNSKTICGFLSENLMSHYLGKKYLDPNLSCVVFGKHKNFFTKNTSKNSYDQESLFSKFYKKNGIICNLNLNAGSTFLHFLERMLNVEYRFDKKFKGKIKIKSQVKKDVFTIFVKKKKVKKKINFDRFTQMAIKKNFYKKIKLGRGFLGSISAKNCMRLLKAQLKKNQYFLFE